MLGLLSGIGFLTARAMARRHVVLPVSDTKVVGRRVVAHLVDWLIMGMTWIAGSVLSVDIAIALDISPDDYWESFGDWYGAVGLLILVGLNWLVLQAVTGYSIGKLLLGIRVVDEAGRAPGVVRALKRFVPLLIEQLGLVALWAMGRHPRNQRFGDRWAHTYVVRALPAEPDPLQLAAPT